MAKLTLISESASMRDFPRSCMAANSSCGSVIHRSCFSYSSLPPARQTRQKQRGIQQDAEAYAEDDLVALQEDRVPNSQHRLRWEGLGIDSDEPLQTEELYSQTSLLEMFPQLRQPLRQPEATSPFRRQGLPISHIAEDAKVYVTTAQILRVVVSCSTDRPYFQSSARDLRHYITWKNVFDKDAKQPKPARHEGEFRSLHKRLQSSGLTPDPRGGRGASDQR
eukprot:762890-Hanusia_phi.AAC.7